MAGKLFLSEEYIVRESRAHSLFVLAMRKPEKTVSITISDSKIADSHFDRFPVPPFAHIHQYYRRSSLSAKESLVETIST